MILIADSGSSKADWNLADETGVVAKFNTMGLNPVFVDSRMVISELSKVQVVNEYAGRIHKVYFFGSGCSSAERNAVIANGLHAVFPNADLMVAHDLDACVYATCGNEPGIACILGTGSNSCYYDGKLITEFNHGLGYILGDEGSGTYYGKKLLAHYLYGIMPADLRSEFKKLYQLTKEDIIQQVYKNVSANVFLASFTTFMTMHRNHKWIQDLLHSGFGEFLDVNVLTIPQHKNVPVHFIGSIAFHFQEELKKTAMEQNLKVGVIIKKPIDGLTNYFLTKN